LIWKIDVFLEKVELITRERFGRTQPRLVKVNMMFFKRLACQNHGIVAVAKEGLIQVRIQTRAQLTTGLNNKLDRQKSRSKTQKDDPT
jgi:hypothetical protein